MAQLDGEQLFLSVRLAPSLTQHQVEIFSNFDDALSGWKSSTRASPIFPINGSQFPVMGEEDCYIFFIGPVDPGAYDLTDIKAFSSYGIYNLILVADNNDQNKIIRVLSEVDNASWEAWHIKNSLIIDVAYSPNLTIDNEERATKSNAKYDHISVELRGAVEEYRTLVAVAMARCRTYIPELTQDLAIFDSQFSAALASPHDHHITKLAWLVNVNAALSRFSSQTFAGISPILQTECHFWTHSLLGIGLATQALTSIRRHHDTAMARSLLPEKLLALKGIPATDPKNLMSRGICHPDWREHRLQKVDPSIDSSPADYLKLIVYFSGRDGFRSTNFTLSAPLEAINGCNTFAWSPLTLTHELCHVISITLLGILLDGLNHQETLDRLAAYLNPRPTAQKPTNAFEQAQQALIHAYYFLEVDHTGIITERFVVENNAIVPLIQRHHAEMFELITHAIDFQYFYQRDVTQYLTSIWASWDVIPNIESRLDDYIIRSLTSVLTNGFLVENPIDHTLDIVETELEKISNKFPDSIYINYALKRLKSHRDGFKDRLSNRTHIAKFVMAFLYDPRTAANIAREVGGAGGSYADLRIGEYSDIGITNPLTFLMEYAKDRRPDAKRSIWMLHQLAFARAP